ncbi:MAG: DNA polymerase IV [Oscillospiraceae bacterium]|nr:DNA polymerase IV [Oscillospiraceae bacterium]
MSRLIFHIDVNSAYLSWEAARRVANGEADLRLIPSAIGGDREKRTGVILAKSILAKKFGVRTGEPVAIALRKCPDLVLARPDFRLYERSSKAFMDICREYAPVVEKYSIDECFLDMSGTHRIYPDPVAIAHTIKDKIRDTLGFTVNVGIGENKILAKMASDFEKPDKVHTLYLHEIPAKLWPLPVRELFTVGASTAEKLENARIRTIGDLAHTPPERVQKIVGMKLGKQLHDYANGIDDSPVLAEPEAAKGYSISTTLEEDVVKAEQAHPVLLALTDSVTARMRVDGFKAYCVAVSIRSIDFKTRSHQRKLYDPTDISSEVYRLCKQLFAELWDGHTPLRLIGVALTDLTREEPAQISLFPDEKKERSRKLDAAYDAIHKKFGASAIQRGSSLQSKLDVGKKYKAQMEVNDDPNRKK